MAAPVATYQTPDQISPVGDKYQEYVKLVVDGSTATFSLVTTALSKVKYIEEVIGCASVIAANGQSAALSGLPLSSTLQILVRGRAGS